MSRVFEKPIEEIMKKKKEKETREIREFHLPTYQEIPGVGLYLDQTSKYITECLNDFDDCEITNSMISNYVKKDLIDHPVKKQYGRDQIAHLLFIAMTKSALSLDDVASLFRMQKDIYSCEEAYGCFRDFFEKLYYGEQIDLRKEVKIEKILLRDIVSLIVQNEALHRRLKEVTVIK